MALPPLGAPSCGLTSGAQPGGSKWLVMSLGTQLLFAGMSFLRKNPCLPGQTQNIPEPEATPFGSLFILIGGSSELPDCPLFPDSDPHTAPCTPFPDPISPLPQLLELSAVLFGTCKLSMSLPCLQCQLPLLPLWAPPSPSAGPLVLTPILK